MTLTDLQSLYEIARLAQCPVANARPVAELMERVEKHIFEQLERQKAELLKKAAAA